MKKNVMTAIVSGAMVGCLAIGGTFAYLTANSGKVTNTFSGTAGLGVKIAESADDGDTYDIDLDNSKGGTATADGGYTIDFGDNDGNGIAYKNVVPGAVIDKEVNVKVEKNPTASYLYVTITNANPKYSITERNTKFVLVDGYTDLYVLTDGAGNYVKVNSSESDQVYNVFTTIKADENVTDVADLTNNGISVKAFIVQAEGIADTSVADQQAAEGLGATEA